MSILDTNTIDGMGLQKDGRELRLLLTDHLDWNDEKEHLLILQEKINVYILFYESQQYKQCDSNYAKAPIEYVVIEIHSKYALPSLAIQFLEHVQEQINELGIIVECHITGDGTDEN